MIWIMIHQIGKHKATALLKGNCSFLMFKIIQVDNDKIPQTELFGGFAYKSEDIDFRPIKS